MLTARSVVSRLAAPLHRALYHANVIDHYENPRNVCDDSSAHDSFFACLSHANKQVGSLDKSKKSVGTGLVGAPACGDVMKLQASERRYRLH